MVVLYVKTLSHEKNNIEPSRNYLFRRFQGLSHCFFALILLGNVFKVANVYQVDKSNFKSFASTPTTSSHSSLSGKCNFDAAAVAAKEVRTAEWDATKCRKPNGEIGTVEIPIECSRQAYKRDTTVIYDTRAVVTRKLPILTTLES